MIPGRIRESFLPSIALFVLCTAVSAEVLDAGPVGFTISHTTRVATDRTHVYNVAVKNVGDWWSDDHTVSGKAANMYIDERILGCFCETVGEGSGVVHLLVTFVNPGVVLRLTGGLGPLGLMGVSGNMTWEFEDGDNGSTTVTWKYAVGGYYRDGLDSIADAVDAVLLEQLTSLKTYAEGRGN